MKHELNQTVVDHLSLNLSGKVTYGSALVGFYGYVASIDWIGLSAVLFGVIGLSANIYFLIKRDRREKRESDIRVKAISGQNEE